MNTKGTLSTSKPLRQKGVLYLYSSSLLWLIWSDGTQIDLNRMFQAANIVGLNRRWSSVINHSAHKVSVSRFLLSSACYQFRNWACIHTDLFSGFNWVVPRLRVMNWLVFRINRSMYRRSKLLVQLQAWSALSKGIQVRLSRTER